MPTAKSSHWTLLQLDRMTRNFPERVEEAIQTLLEADPALRDDLVLGAVDQEQLTLEQAADYLGLSLTEVEIRLTQFREAMLIREIKVEKDAAHGVARLSTGGLTVWEIVRELRRVGSEEGLMGQFPSLSRDELAVALKYADEHQSEIESEINRYDAVVQRRQAEYPFAK
jgi:uncharacterized protein (DUF433 family)